LGLHSMGKVVLDRRGDLQKSVFYRFNVQFEDAPHFPDKGAIIVPRVPANSELVASGKEPYRWITITGDSNKLVEAKDCVLDKTHVTHSYFTKLDGEAYGGNRVSPIIPTSGSDTVVLSDDLRCRIERLRLRGSRIDPINLTESDNGPKLHGFWALQFVGKIILRLPKLVDTPNACPHCGRGKLMCEGCGEWSAYCSSCRKQMVTTENMHKGPDDKRIPIEEDGIWRVLEGKCWDGNDLVQAKAAPFASKRFIDWLLRIHAAPFYAEPVYFCVDGMSDQQKKWFEDLQKPFDI
jgi:hypothetical protein